MNNAVFLIPILSSIGAFALIFGIVYLKTRENMALIEKGMNPKKYANSPAPFRSLKIGLLFLGAGLGLLLAYFIDFNVEDRGDNPAIYFSLIAVGGGLGLIISYFVERKEWMNNKTDTGEI